MPAKRRAERQKNSRTNCAFFAERGYAEVYSMWGAGFLSSPLGLATLVVVVGVLAYVAFAQRKQRRQRQREAQEVLEEVEGSERWRGKRVCVIVNPYGGQGEGERIFKEIVSPMFRRAGLQIDKLGKSIALSPLVNPLTIYPYRK